MEWIYTKERNPICTEKGNWDGLRSDKVIVQDSKGETFIAVLYSGFIDGSDFNDWYDVDDFEISDIVRWTSIPE